MDPGLVSNLKDYSTVSKPNAGQLRCVPSCSDEVYDRSPSVKDASAGAVFSDAQVTVWIEESDRQMAVRISALSPTVVSQLGAGPLLARRSRQVGDYLFRTECLGRTERDLAAALRALALARSALDEARDAHDEAQAQLLDASNQLARDSEIAARAQCRVITLSPPIPGAD